MSWGKHRAEDFSWDRTARLLWDLPGQGRSRSGLELNAERAGTRGAMSGTTGLALAFPFGTARSRRRRSRPGCIAGPVTAAAVIPGPQGAKWMALGLDDSKKLGVEARSALRERIEAEATAWSVGWASVEEIERLNILQATYLAMHRAIDGLAVQPEHLLIDGNRFRPHDPAAHVRDPWGWPVLVHCRGEHPRQDPPGRPHGRIGGSPPGVCLAGETRGTPRRPTNKPCWIAATRATTGEPFGESKARCFQGRCKRL